MAQSQLILRNCRPMRDCMVVLLVFGYSRFSEQVPLRHSKGLLSEYRFVNVHGHMCVMSMHMLQ